MMDVWVGRQSLDIVDAATAAGRFSRGLLASGSEAAGPAHVEVHVRSYHDSSPLARPISQSQPGRLPVGTLMDCYV